MEMTNWIEKIKEAVRIAMNKGLYINNQIGYFKDCYPYNNIIIKNKVNIYIFNNKIEIYTQTGYIKIEHSLTDREKLEIQALIISIKEYQEDMAISEFEEFISDKKEEITDINNLDDDE